MGNNLRHAEVLARVFGSPAVISFIKFLSTRVGKFLPEKGPLLGNMHLKSTPCYALLLSYTGFNPSQRFLSRCKPAVSFITTRTRASYLLLFFLLRTCIISNKRKVKNFIIQCRAGIIKGSKVTDRYTPGFNRRNNRLLAKRALGGARRAP